MENEKTNEPNNDRQSKEPQEKQPWIIRNAWIIAVGLAIFLLRMCHEVSR